MLEGVGMWKRHAETVVEADAYHKKGFVWDLQSVDSLRVLKLSIHNELEYFP